MLGNEQKIPKKDGPPGVTKSKIDEIKSKIGPMIPKEKMQFWHDIPTNENSKDLTINYDHLQKQAGKADELNLSNSSTPRVMRRESSF